MAVYLVRHAVAVGRSSWDGPDRRRPLTGKGQRQAEALVRLLRDADIRRILSSPALRCRETVAPLARARRIAIHDVDEFAEGADAESAAALLSDVAGKKGDTVVCTHGDLVPDVLRRLTRQRLELQSELQFAKGSTWELRTDHGTLVAGQYHPPAE